MMNHLALRPQRKAQLRRFAERGLTTVEYAIGLLAAATVAIMLVRVFSDNAILEVVQGWVINIFDKVIHGSFNIQDLFNWAKK